MILKWIEAHLLSCPLKAQTGLDCPGCGFQRSMLALFQGDIAAAFHLYPPSIPIAMLFLFTPTHLKFDFKHGALVIKILYLAVAVTVVLNYIYKIYNHKLH